VPDTPLAGLRVLELGAFIAGPFAGQLLGDLGADVIKVEPPGTGDIMRRYGVRIAKRDGEVQSLWWPAIARNKRSVAIDLRDERGRALARRIAAQCDVVLENFKPGTVERWGMSYDELARDNPGIVLVHVSGFGQTGPRAAEPGFGSIGEAMGGIRYTTGEPDRPPARTGISIGDSLAALFAVVGTLAALQERTRSGRGQEVDVAIYEAVLALMESTVADYELGDVIRTRRGGVLQDVAPANAYPTADGTDVVIAGNADAVFARLCTAMERPDLARDLASHEARAARQEELDAQIAAWSSTMVADDLIALLRAHDVPVGAINSAPELASDPHIAAREMIARLAAGYERDVAMAGVVPKLSRTPGSIRHVGPALGAHTDEVLRDLARATDAEIRALRDAGVLA
jgi:crotonobetainyl-CoA:carnitine CoA-transferase CaiB-like acyl-CoA transferase